MPLLHPGTSLAIANMIGPVFYAVLALAIGCLVWAWVRHIRLWLKERREDREPSEFDQFWPQETRK